MLAMSGDTPAAQPGQAVAYTVTLRNTTPEPLSSVQVEVAFPSDKLAITETSGGIINDDRIGWSMAALAPGQVQVYTYKGTVSMALRQGDTIRTSVSMRAANLPAPLAASVDVAVGSASSSSSFSASSLSSASGQPGTASASSFAGAPVSISLQASATEAQPGKRIRYTMTVRNLTASSLEKVAVVATVPAGQMQVTNVGDGVIDGSSMHWTIPTLPSLDARSLSFEAAPMQGVRQGEMLRMLSQAAVGGALVRSNASDVRVIGLLPQAGAESRFLAPLEDTSRFLTPVTW